MNVTLTISKEYAEPQINIYAPETTADINKLISYIQNAEKMIAVNEEDSIVILKPEEIYMICSTGRGVKVFCEKRNTLLPNVFMNSKKCWVIILYGYQKQL